MKVMDPASLAVLALTNRLVDVGVAPLKAAELWRLLEAIPDPAELFGRSSSDLAQAFEGAVADPDRVAALLDSGLTLGVRLEGLRERGIWLVTPFDDSYPARLKERLGTNAPPVLYGAGEAGLLAEPGIGIVGSRDVGEDGADVARAAATAAAGRGLGVVSGGARGVDQIAMQAAEDAGGTVVAVLADSLEKAIGQRDTRRVLLAGQACLCTPYRPDARFTVGNAMGRNKIIYALSRVTLVVASGRDSGGTWAGATEAMTKRYGTVAVWRGAGEGPGNAAIEQAGAVPVTIVDHLFDLEPGAPTPTVPAPSGVEHQQLSLLDSPAPAPAPASKAPITD